ncbi:MAG: ArsR/SmtB family transcription factor [Galactobacter sp.]
MVAHYELSESETDLVFHALAASTRRDILRRTMAEEQSVTGLAQVYDMSFAAVQKHVSVLERAELIVKRAEGRQRFIRANASRLEQARNLLAQYEDQWRDRVTRLETFLDQPLSPGTPDEPDIR